MADIKKRIESGEEYELVLCADDICRACPNLQNGVCVNEAKVGKYDLKTKMLGTGNLENTRHHPAHHPDRRLPRRDGGAV